MSLVLDGIIGTFDVPANTTPGAIPIPAGERDGQQMIAYQFPGGRSNDIKLQYDSSGEDSSRYVPIAAADGFLTSELMMAKSAPRHIYSAVAETIVVIVWRVRDA